MAETDKIELHTRFFNAEKILYSAMDASARIAHREELAMLIFEARARMNAIDDVDRHERAKLSKDGKEWLVTNSDITVSSALTEPKVRAARMSKADKLKESMLSLGLNITDVNAMMGSIQKSATDKDMNRISFNREEKESNNISELCRIGSHTDCRGGWGDVSGSHKCECECGHSPKAEAEPEEPFDPSSLFE